MNKLIPGALFSVRAAREQRLLADIHPYSCNICSDAGWERATNGFERLDPMGRILATLMGLQQFEPRTKEYHEMEEMYKWLMDANSKSRSKQYA